MRTGKSNREEDEFEEEEFISKKEGSSSTSFANVNSNSKDAKNNDKANAIRSKHSVTEQRRRSKINERFQMLRDLIPHSDQKRDTASFLLEVIEYVRYLQEKVQKYEGSYQSWSGEPAKLMPWRNSHWRAQNFASSVPGLTCPGKFDESQNLEDSLANRDLVRLGNGANIGTPFQVPLQVSIPSPVRSDGILARPLQAPASNVQSAECLDPSETLNQPEEVTIEGGTISISSLYSEGLLNTLTQALKGAGVDLSQASISIQIDIGKRAARTSALKDHESNEDTMHTKDRGSVEDSNQAVKRKFRIYSKKEPSNNESARDSSNCLLPFSSDYCSIQTATCEHITTNNKLLLRVS